jgi:CysZ protein
LRYPWRGARFVYFEHRSLLRFWLPPVLITLALIVAAIALAFSFEDRLADALWTAPSGSGWFETLQRGLHRAFEWLIALVLIGFAVIAVAALSSAIAAPFNDALSAAVESLYGGGQTPPFQLRVLLRDIVRSVAFETLKLAVYGTVMLGLLVFAWVVPGLGALVQTVVGGVLTALYFAIDHVDWAASRHGLSLRERLGFVARHLRPMLGFGAGVWLLLFVPLVNLLFMPAAVAGGTLLFLDLRREALSRITA